MKVNHPDGNTRTFPASEMHGFVADTIELTAVDARYMRTLFEKDPVLFGAWIRQFEARFAGNRFPNEVPS